MHKLPARINCNQGKTKDNQFHISCNQGKQKKRKKGQLNLFKVNVWISGKVIIQYWGAKLGQMVKYLFNLFSKIIITNVPYRYSYDLWYISFNIQSRNLWNISLKGQDINIQLINLTFAEPFYIQQCWIVISLVQNWYQNYIILV